MLLLGVWLWLAGSARGDDRVFLAVPLSLQPYYIPYTDRGLIYETIEAAFAARDRRLFPVYVAQRQMPRILARRSDIDCAGFQTSLNGEDWFTADEPYAFNDDAVTLTENHIQLDGLSDLQDKTVIAYKGARGDMGEVFRRAVADNPQYREIYNHRAQVQLLLRHRVQVIIADQLLVNWYVRHLARESGEDYELTYHELLPSVKTSFACRAHELLEAYKEGLAEIRSNGELDRIRSRYIE